MIQWLRQSRMADVLRKTLQNYTFSAKYTPTMATFLLLLWLIRFFPCPNETAEPSQRRLGGSFF